MVYGYGVENFVYRFGAKKLPYKKVLFFYANGRPGEGTFRVKKDEKTFISTCRGAINPETNKPYYTKEEAKALIKEELMEKRVYSTKPSKSKRAKAVRGGARIRKSQEAMDNEETRAAIMAARDSL